MDYGDLKIVSGKEVRAHPLHLFLIILLYGAMLPWDFSGRVHTRALESKIPPTYLNQKDRNLIKRVHLLRLFYPSLLQNLLPLLDSHTKR